MRSKAGTAGNSTIGTGLALVFAIVLAVLGLLGLLCCCAGVVLLLIAPDQMAALSPFN